MKQLSITVVVIFIGFSCTKSSAPGKPASITVINAVIGSRELVTNFSGTDSILYAPADLLSFGTFNPTSNAFGEPNGITMLGLYEYPDTLSKEPPLFNLTLNLTGNSIHTLFLVGILSSPDTLFMNDVLPYYPYNDSVLGIRFVNLSYGSNPVSINITGNPLGSEVNALAYKGFSGFQTYAATALVNSYSFEFHDVTSGALLATYSFQGINSGLGANASSSSDAYLFRNFTLALIGSPDSSGQFAQNALLINDY